MSQYQEEEELCDEELIGPAPIQTLEVLSEGIMRRLQLNVT